MNLNAFEKPQKNREIRVEIQGGREKIKKPVDAALVLNHSNRFQ